ncbi:MAG: bacterial Ig-like domain-containing protein [Clostridia bacterium]|nr:bacterial Ig-like domain-containing protein [Clostridia bacterium]
MDAIIINREILLDEDFTGDFREKLCAYLNGLIDSELAKGDETDFDLIDEYADAINCIRDGGADGILPVISKHDFYKALGIKSVNPAFKIAAAAAAIIIVFGAGTALLRGSQTDIIAKTAEYFRELFGVHEIEPVAQTVTEQTAEAVTKAEKTTAPAPVFTGIELDFGENFRREYYVGERFDKTGLGVYLICAGGKQAAENYEIITGAFAEKAGEQTVTVSAGGFSESFTVRILNNEKTPLLNSIYATFPDGFDFTYNGEPDLSGMRVYAVYSDGSEKELTPGEYTVSIDETKLPFRKSAAVKVEYEGCTSEFVMKGVLK